MIHIVDHETDPEYKRKVDLRGLNKVESGDWSIKDFYPQYIFDRLFPLAIELKRHTVIDKIQTYFNLPKDLTLKEQLCYYYLLKENTDV